VPDSSPGPTREVSRAELAEADIDQVVTAVLTASRLLIAVSARSLASVEDTLTLPQFRLLVVLDSRGDMSLSRLADHLAVNPSTALRMAERLKVLDMIARGENVSDRREVRWSLTESGRRTVREVTARRRKEIAGVAAAIPASQRVELVQALRTFTEAGGEPEAAQTDLLW
jgi:DNA-binding MarR family transcriptional regulator